MARKRKRSRGRSDGTVSRRSLLLLASTGVVAGTGAYMSGAFESVSGGRGVGVETADDDDSNAFLRVDTQEPEGNSGGDPVTLFGLRNQFGAELTHIHATVLDGDSLVEEPLQTPDNLQPEPPNNEGTIEAELSCSANSTEDIEVEISASGSGQSVDLIRSVEVSCLRGITIEITIEITDLDQFGPPGNPNYRVSWSATAPNDTTVNIRLSFDGANGETSVEKTGSHEDTAELIREGGNPDAIIAEIRREDTVEDSDSRDV